MTQGALDGFLVVDRPVVPADDLAVVRWLIEDLFARRNVDIARATAGTPAHRKRRASVGLNGSFL